MFPASSGIASSITTNLLWESELPKTLVFTSSAPSRKIRKSVPPVVHMSTTTPLKPMIEHETRVVSSAVVHGHDKAMQHGTDYNGQSDFNIHLQACENCGSSLEDSWVSLSGYHDEHEIDVGSNTSALLKQYLPVSSKQKTATSPASELCHCTIFESTECYNTLPGSNCNRDFNGMRIPLMNI